MQSSQLSLKCFQLIIIHSTSKLQINSNFKSNNDLIFNFFKDKEPKSKAHIGRHEKLELSRFVVKLATTTTTAHTEAQTIIEWI